MIWHLILIGAFLYLAVVIRGQFPHQKQMELGLGVRITSLETQVGDLQDRVNRIEDTLAVSKESFGRTVPDVPTVSEDAVFLAGSDPRRDCYAVGW